LLAAVLVSVSNLVLKLAIHRPRPAADLVHVNGTYASYSFPSGHVMFYAGYFGYIMFLAFTVFKSSWKRTLLLLSRHSCASGRFLANVFGSVLVQRCDGRSGIDRINPILPLGKESFFRASACRKGDRALTMCRYMQS
jgi:hypothetical protein